MLWPILNLIAHLDGEKSSNSGQQASLLQNGDTDFDNPRGCVMSPAYTVQVTQSWLCMHIDSFLKYTVFITL